MSKSDNSFYSDEFEKKVSEVAKSLNGLSVSQAKSVLTKVDLSFNSNSVVSFTNYIDDSRTPNSDLNSRRNKID